MKEGIRKTVPALSTLKKIDILQHISQFRFHPQHEGQRHLNDYFPYSPIREHQLPSGREIRGFHCLNVNFSRPEQKERLVQKQIQMPKEWEPGEKNRARRYGPCGLSPRSIPYNTAATYSPTVTQYHRRGQV